MRAFVLKSALGGWTLHIIDDDGGTLQFYRLETYDYAIGMWCLLSGRLAR